MSSCSTHRGLLLTFAIVLVTVVFGNQPSSTEHHPKSNDGLSTSSDSMRFSLDGLDEAGSQKLQTTLKVMDFGVAVPPMLKFIINNLYRNKEIFLRELVSNAADALDKLRLMSLGNSTIANSIDELSIKIKVNKDDKTLHILDTGIGMTAEDLVQNLGTIAKSGTAEFMKQLVNAGSDEDKQGLIGQFGVGFYSSFLVAERVVVVSKNDADEQYIWESDTSAFSYAKDPRGDTLKRGTEIILHMNEEAAAFLDTNTLERVLNKYSSFINFDIFLWKSRMETVDVDDESEKTDSDAEVEDDTKKEKKTEKREVFEWQLINKQKPIWKRKPSEISDEEYTHMFGNMSLSAEAPLAKTHFSVEGDVSFTAIVFIPKKPPYNMLMSNFNFKDRIKLYVKQVHVSDAAEDLIPNYLAFLLGLVNCDEIPINISREVIQQPEFLKVIRKKLVRKVLDLLKKLPEDDYSTFWEKYSINLKLGMIDDNYNRARISKLLRYRTSKSDGKLVPLDEYVSRMKKTQKSIFYVTASSQPEAQNLPFTERLIKRGYEVVYMTDPIDEFLIQSFTEYSKKPFQNIAKEGIVLDADDRVKKQKDFEELTKWLVDEGLKGLIEKAEISEVLTSSPCALIAGQYGWTANQERILSAQAYQAGEHPGSKYYASAKKTLSINPRHPLIKELKSRIQADPKDKEAIDAARLLFDLASLRSGYPLSDSMDFAHRMESVMRKTLQVDADESVEEEEDVDVVDQDESSAEDRLQDPKDESESTSDNISDTTKDEL